MRDFYGLKRDGSIAEEGGGMSAGPGAGAGGQTDLDSKVFVPARYLEELVQKSTLEELMRTAARLSAGELVNGDIAIQAHC
jgi:hypothetical protein